MLSEQLQVALDSRVIVEQAKGMIAQGRGIDMDAAFRAIRAHSRGEQLRLQDVATAIVDGALDVT